MFTRYRKLRISDRTRFEKIAAADAGASAYFSFCSTLLVQVMYENSYAFIHNCLIMKPDMSGGPVWVMYPVGARKDRRKVARWLFRKYHQKGEKFVFFAATQEEAEDIRQDFGSDVEVELDRDSQCYIFSAADQIGLQGSKFADRRNKLKRFSKNHSWSYADLTPERLSECIRLNSEWYDAHDKEAGAIDGEQRALKYCFENYAELGVNGGVLTVDSEVAAFCIGVRVNEKTYEMLFQKARREVRDASIMLLHAFFARHCSECEYINYSEDMGIEGLRKFKMMMHPLFLTDSYHVTISR